MLLKQLVDMPAGQHAERHRCQAFDAAFGIPQHQLLKPDQAAGEQDVNDLSLAVRCQLVAISPASIERVELPAEATGLDDDAPGGNIHLVALERSHKA